MMKRLSSFMVALFLATTALWAYDFKEGDLCYNITSSSEPYTVEVTYQTDNSLYNYQGLTSVTIPATVTYNDITYSVTSIGYEAFGGCKSLTSVTISNGVISIVSRAFDGCTGLTSVTILNSVTSIGMEAFRSCTGLTSITIPESVTSISRDAFYSCTGLTSVVWNAKNCGGGSSDSPFYYIHDNITSFTFGDEVESIPSNLCYRMNKLTSITIPNSVTSIGENAFYGCTGLTSITIPTNVKNIEYQAFYHCTGLTSVVWNAKNCDESPFGDVNDSITSFTFGDAVERIPAYLCSEMRKLTTITIPNSVTSIGIDAFYSCTGLTSVTIGNSVTEVGGGAFQGCTGLTSITIPNSVTQIGGSAFSGCTRLTTITIPNSVIGIGDNAFRNMFNIVYNGTATGSPWGARSVNGYVDGYFVYKDVSKTILLACSSAATGVITIPNSVTSIGDNAFYNCTGLTSITIPNSVTNIGNDAFRGCTSLTSITIPNSVTSIGEKAFYGCTGLTSITIPNSVTSIERCTFDGCTGLTSITIPNSVTSIGDYAFSGCTSLASVTIPNSVKSLGKYAFDGCTGLTSIIIPNSITRIEYETFYGCTGLTSVTIPNSVTTIMERVFMGCTGLKSIIIPNSVTWLDDEAFQGCTGLTSIIINVAVIKDRVFSGCTGLTSVTIGDSVQYIGDNAFKGCTNLKKVNYTGDVRGWLGIDMRTDNYQGYNSSNPVYYSRNLYINDVLLKNLVIPDGTTNISHAFAYNECLTSVTIPNSVTSIGAGAFYDCTNLTSVTIPDSVRNIGNYAFYNCRNLIISELPKNLRSIGRYTFGMCKLASTIIIPDSVTSIGADAFGDKNLKMVTFLPPNPPSIETTSRYESGRPFGNNTSLELIVPAQSLEAYKASDLNYYNITTHGLSTIDEKVTQTTIQIDAVPARMDSTQFVKVGYVFNGDSVWLDKTDTIHIERNNLFCSTEYDISLFAAAQDSIAVLYSTTLKTLPIRLDLKNVMPQQASVSMRAIYDFGDIPLKQYGIQIAKGKDSEQYETFVLNGSNNIDSIVQINGLTPNTDYMMRGFYESSVKLFDDNSSNSKTATYYSYPVTFTTKSVVVDTPAIMDYAQTYMLLSTSCNYGDATLVEEAVEYGTSQSDTQKASVSNNMVKINNLLPDTRYYYRSLLTTAEGGTIYSDWQEMTTKAITLSTGEADGISAKSVFLHGTIDCDMESRTEIGFEWKRSDAPATVKPQRVLVINRVDSNLVFRLEGLSKDKYYDYRAFCLYKGETYYGTADDGREWVTFLTAEDDVLVAPSVQTLGAEVSETGVELKGFVVAGTENIIQEGFESWRKGTTDVATTVSTGAIMTNEIPEPWSYTTYQYRAYAKTPSGTTYGETKEVTTGYIHTDIQDVVVTPSATTANVTWTIVEQADYYILTLFGNAEMTDTLATYTVDTEGNITQRRAPAALRALVNCTIDQLTPETDYFFTVIAYNAEEKKVAEENGTFTTTPKPTTALDNVEDTAPNGDNRNGDTLNGNGTTATTARKVFRNGQVLILRNGKTYTLTGVEVE